MLWRVSLAPLRGSGSSGGSLQLLWEAESWLLQGVPLAAPRGCGCSGGSHWLLWGGRGCSGGSQQPLQGVPAALGWGCPMAPLGGPSCSSPSLGELQHHGGAQPRLSQPVTVPGTLSLSAASAVLPFRSVCPPKSHCTLGCCWGAGRWGVWGGKSVSAGRIWGGITTLPAPRGLLTAEFPYTAPPDPPSLKVLPMEGGEVSPGVGGPPFQSTHGAVGSSHLGVHPKNVLIPPSLPHSTHGGQPPSTGCG